LFPELVVNCFQQAVMNTLADLTGGIAVYNRNDIDGAVARSIEHGSTYYTLGYYPSNQNWNGKFRKIEVRLERKDVQVRSRKGYYAIDPQTPIDATLSRQEFLTMMTPGSASATSLPFMVQVNPPTPGESDLEVRFHLEPGVLVFKEQKGLQHDVWGWNWLDDSIRDTAYAVRTILRTPFFSAVIVLSLGIGIGVNSAVFSWIERIVLRPLPGVDNPSDFYRIEPRADSGTYPGSSWLEYKDLRDRLGSFREIFAFRMSPFTVGEGTQAERKSGLFVSDNYFSGLGLRPARGRFWFPDEALQGKPAVVISHAYWSSGFNRDAGILGKTIRANDRLLTVVGVLPEGFQGTALVVDFDLFVPATLAPVMFSGSRELEDRSQRG
jgi:MacB-like protein